MCGGIASPTKPRNQAYVWDLPTRSFHWLLVVSVLGAFVTAKLGGNWMVWHGRFGLAVLGLIAFRLTWGFVGSTYARFASFVRGPRAILAYLKGEWRGQGHNPLGALSVLALLALLGLQGVSGLFSDDEIAYTGHLRPLVEAAVSQRLTGLHRVSEEILLALIALHVGAIVFYARVKKQNLLGPMITGWAPGKPCESARHGGAKAFLFALACAVLMTYLASGLWLATPPAPAPTSAAPAW